METLIKNLTNQTQELKILYVEKIEEFAKTEFDSYEKMSLWKEVDWCNFFGLTPRIIKVSGDNNYPSFPKGFFNSSDSKTWRNLREKAYKIVRMGKEDFVKISKVNAIEHYENSIVKLADRIVKKGLNKDNITLKSSRIGVNFETIATDGIKTVRCFTVLAWGEVQKPHYRYLIK